MMRKEEREKIEKINNILIKILSYWNFFDSMALFYSIILYWFKNRDRATKILTSNRIIDINDVVAESLKEIMKKIII